MVGTDYDGLEVREGVDANLGQILALLVTVERAVDVRARVCNHFYPADLELRAGCIQLPLLLPAQVVADNRSGQALIGDQPIFDRMAQVDERRPLI